jgi:hypothetical protein
VSTIDVQRKDILFTANSINSVNSIKMPKEQQLLEIRNIVTTVLPPVESIVGTSHMIINQYMFVAMQRLVDFISMVTQQYVTTQPSCNALIAGFSVGRSIRDSPLLCNG